MTRITQQEAPGTRGVTRAESPGLGNPGLGNPCDPAAIAWGRQLQLPRGEPFHWAKCGELAGNLVHGLYWVTHGMSTLELQGNGIWSQLWRLMSNGNISPAEADFLWRVGFPTDPRSPGAEFTGGSSGGGSGGVVTGGGSGVPGIFTSSGGGGGMSSITSALSMPIGGFPAYYWIGGLVALLALKRLR